jgi:hypothetical protein
MILQDFLREKGLEALVERTKCKAVRDEDYNNLVLLKYNQIESPMEDPLVQLCRGIVVDEDDNWKVVSWAYNKFFNYNENLAAEIDWSTAKVLEKLDGSCLCLYYYNNEWLVSTTGNPGAKGNVPYSPKKNFEQLFWEVFKELDMELPTDKGKTYIFELMTLENRVVVPHKKNRLVLTGVRDLETFEELLPENFGEHLGCAVAQSYHIRSLDEALKVAANLEGIKHEGFVVRDGNFNRVKVKGKSYVGLHHMKSSIEASPRRLIKIIQENESEEFLNYFPEFSELYNSLKDKYIKIWKEADQMYDNYSGIENQKDFALAISSYKYKTALFALRNNKCTSIPDWMRQQTSNKIEELLENYDE